MKTRLLLACSILATCSAAIAASRALMPAQDALQVLVEAPQPQKPQMQTVRSRIEWDQKTLVRVAGGTYGRMIRLSPSDAKKDDGTQKLGDILCCYEAGGRSWVVRSRDNGRTWGEPLLVKQMARANAANPELLQLASGRLLLFYNQRPHPAKPAVPGAVAQPAERFGIGVCMSEDLGATWRSDEPPIFLSGQTAADGCWEPAAIQMPAGEIQLFFANEAPYQGPDQEITRLRSNDNGRTWGEPENVARRAGHRDGMPVPLLLQDGSLKLAIEDNGLAPGNSLQPAIIDLARGGKLPSVDAASPKRWGAISPALPGSVYAGAPYLRQMARGETILSCQSNEGGGARPAMTVYVGDSQARSFANPSRPFSNPSDVAGSWNSLFVKDAATITAISETIVNGVHGLWSIDGHLVQPEQEAAAK